MSGECEGCGAVGGECYCEDKPLFTIVPKPDPVVAVRDAAAALADARVEFATHFILAHTAWRGDKPLTDRRAQEATIAATKDAVTIAQAELDIALWRLRTQ